MLTTKLWQNADGLLTNKEIRENYHPITGKGLNAKNFSWSAAHILMLLQRRKRNNSFRWYSLDMGNTEATAIADKEIGLETRVSNIFTDNLPGDPEKKNFTRQVYNACYSETRPTKVSGPSMIHFNEDLGADLNLNSEDRGELLQLLSGNANLKGFLPYAMCYGGHQFGNWAGQLGDGRAINIGEVAGVKMVSRRFS